MSACGGRQGMEPVIRVATAGDITALLALIREYWDFEHIDGFDAGLLAPVLADLFARP